ncbi:amidase [Pendulispora brunnea]|uniref:Amidase n=1 Tax=Pendulispora brunnea TaxID=2905690 RepID=A0ABZ2K0H8_9BACT
MDTHFLELMELAAHLRGREVSSLDVTRAQLDRIAALDGALCSYAHVTADAALAQAEAADAEMAAGRYRGPLHGVPIAVKDLCWTEGIPTAAGMAVHAGHRPTEDATVVRRLKEAGAVLLGKLQLTEAAYADHHASIVPPKNPWDAEAWPGMSSSGSGVATAAGLCHGSLGSDTGGSIRFPCAANGVTGLKPTWGRVSRYGVFELAASMDHIGPIARSAADAGAMLRVLAGDDPKDPTASLEPVPDYLAGASRGVHRLRIGIDEAWTDDVAPETKGMLAGAIEAFAALGADLVPVRFPEVTQAIADWFPICAVEAAVAHEATYPARKSEYGPVFAQVLEDGRALSATAYQKVLLRRMHFRGLVDAVLDAIDLLLLPVHPFAPPTLADMTALGGRPELVTRLLRYTCPFDMTGHPSLTLPGGFTPGGMPLAFQLVAKSYDEATLIRAGVAFQGVTSWHRRHPALLEGRA